MKDDPEAILFYSDWIPFPINIMMTICMFYAARLSQEVNRKVFFAWLMMALGELCFTLGDASWAYIETVQKQDPLASLSDIPNLLTYLFFVIGLLLLPSALHSKRDRIKMGLDTIIIIITSVLFFWPLMIEPTIVQNIEADSLTSSPLAGLSDSGSVTALLCGPFALPEAEPSRARGTQAPGLGLLVSGLLQIPFSCARLWTKPISPVASSIAATLQFIFSWVWQPLPR